MALLETRESAMRLSPLLATIAVGKNAVSVRREDQLQVVKHLLLFGARVDARDLCGKGVPHYGAGVMATPSTLQMVKYCCQAYESSHLLFQEVELHSLSTQCHLNGQRGMCHGYNADTGRRIVYLHSNTNKPMAIKPENLKPIDDDSVRIRKIPPRLVDIQDRLGGTCLLETFMSDRTDVAKVLLNDLQADVSVGDWDGFSPESMTLLPNGQLSSAVGPMIMKILMKRSRQSQKASTNECAQCHSTTKPLNMCSKWYVGIIFK